MVVLVAPFELTPPVRRLGHFVALVLEAVAVVAAHHLTAWGWPGFLTSEFDAVLGVLTVALLARMCVEAVYLLHDTGRTRMVGGLVTAGATVAVSLGLLEVFPFDVGAPGTASLVRFLLVLTILATLVEMVAMTVRLFAPRTSPLPPPTMPPHLSVHGRPS